MNPLLTLKPGMMMKPSWNQFWMLAGVLATGLASNAAEQTITLRDWTGRGFAPEVIDEMFRKLKEAGL